MKFSITIVILLSSLNQKVHAKQHLREKGMNDELKAMLMDLEEATSVLEDRYGADRYGADILNNGAETCSDTKSCWDTAKKECIEGICQCKEGWESDGGNGCQDLDECKLLGDSYPCDHEGGSCVNHAPNDGKYECICSDGYDGSDDHGYGPEKCIAKEPLTLRMITSTPTVASSIIVTAPTVNPSVVPTPDVCPLSEIDFPILTKKGLVAKDLNGESTEKPSFEFTLPKASQRLLIFFDFVEKGSWDGVGIRGDQNDFVGLKLESPTRDSIALNFGGFHHGVFETSKEGDEDGIYWSVTSSDFWIDSKSQVHNVAVEIEAANLSYKSEVLNLIIDYNLAGLNDEWLIIENLQIHACMDTVPSASPSEFPTSAPSAVPTTPAPITKHITTTLHRDTPPLSEETTTAPNADTPLSPEAILSARNSRLRAERLAQAETSIRVCPEVNPTGCSFCGPGRCVGDPIVGNRKILIFTDLEGVRHDLSCHELEDELAKENHGVFRFCWPSTPHQQNTVCDCKEGIGSF